MLTLIIGRGKSGKTERLLELLKNCPASGMSERILIVPEQLSHQMERRLSAFCGDGISFSAEVLSFTRLQNRVSSFYGGGARKTLDQGGRLLTARLALSSIQSQLKVFASTAGKTEFLSGILSMIDEFKSYDITPRILMEASRQSEGFFAQKLQELSLILGAYDAVMAQGTCDPRDKLTLLRDQLQKTNYAENRWFFVDGFIDFSAQEFGILDVLMRRSESMVITLPLNQEDQTGGLFTPAGETCARLLSMAKAAGQEVKIVRVDYRREIPAALTYLEKYLFAYPTPVFAGDASPIKIISASDRMAECRHCASELLRHAMDGVRWRDMAVAAGDPEYYGPVMEMVCREYGIPLYTGIKTPITGHPAVAFLLCALEAVTEGMEVETVTAYLRTGYSGLSPDDCDMLENYAYTWAISGSKWGRAWTEHPDGYDGRFTQEIRQELENLNALRVRAAEPLLRLQAGLRSAGNIRGQIQAIYRFFEDTTLFSQINEQIQEETECGRIEAAQETAQIWNAVVECLQQIVSVLGETAQNSGELLKILRSTLSQYELGTIPSVLDAVSFGGVDSVRGMEPRILYVLGVNEGIIPETGGGNSLLTERERIVLKNQLNIELAPDSEGAMERQLLQVYGTLTAPREMLYLSCCQSHGGEQMQPSFLIGRLSRMFPQALETVGQWSATDAMTVEGATELFLLAEETGDQALYDSIRTAARQVPELENAIVDAKSASLPRELLVPRAYTTRIFGESVTLTASRLDQLAKCPMSFFLNFGLKARQIKAASFDAAEYGTFLHYILEKTVADLVDSQRTLPLPEPDSRDLVQRYMTPYLEQRMQETEDLTQRQKYLYQRNVDEAGQVLMEISQELSVSDFTPCAYELKFGANAELGELTIHSTLGNGHLDGTVDRVDLWQGPDGDYFRIIDYKSGSKTFDYTDLNQGVGMQLFLYLFALKNSGIPFQSAHPQPAGALYFPTKRLIRSVEAGLSGEQLEEKREGKDPKRTGLVLSDRTVLEAMEHDVSGRYLPVKGDKPGDYAISADQMDHLELFIQRQMQQAVDRIYSGHFEPEPFYRKEDDNACQYCEYGDVCQKDSEFRRSFYTPKISAQAFWETIGGDDHG